MFGMNIRFQIAAVVICGVILLDFLRSKKIPTATNKNFTVMIVLSLINLAFDITTVYTITHMDEIPEAVNLFAHRGLYLTISSVVQAFYYYVRSLDSDRVTENKLLIILLNLPFVAAGASALFLPVSFYTDGNMQAYSEGKAVEFLFLAVALQLAVIFVCIIRNKIPTGDKIMLLLGIFFWIVVCLIQFFLPHIFLTGFGIAVMLMFVYLSFENPAEYIDRQTGCCNRYAFDCVLREKMLSAKPFSIINIVFDEMDLVVSRFGYSAGHGVMKQAGLFLSSQLGKGAYIFRDNSVAFFCTTRDDQENAEKSVSERLGMAWTVGDIPIMVRSHADVLRFPDFAHNSFEVNNTLKYACENNDPEGCSGIINHIDQNCVNSIHRQTQINELLKSAVNGDGFEIYYQPIYSAEEKACTAAEAFVRLKDNYTLGYISPAEFIPIAEQSDIIMDIGYIIFEKVCRFISENDLGKRGLKYIDVNISQVQAVNSELPDRLSEIMERYGIQPGYINLEITETTAAQSQKAMETNIKRLKELGVSISMDNFGTGCSNLAHMSENAYNLIKLDKSLIWSCFDPESGEPLPENGKSYVILSSAIALMRRLDTQTTAVGIETKKQAQYLAGKGIQYLQGYYFSKPISEQEFASADLSGFDI